MEEIRIDSSDAGKRLDVFLSNALDMTRNRIQGIISGNNVSVNGKVSKGSLKLSEGDCVEVNIPDPVELDVVPEDIDIDILYEDEYVVVVNKPQGMVVHPAAGNYTGTLVNALLYRCNSLSTINGVVRPGIVHRIDKDTSGILVVAKNDVAHNSLAMQLKDHSMTRIYTALTEGVIKQDSGTIDKPIARHPVERKKMAIVEGGREAVTHYTVIERFKRNTLINAKLETGRTHQIRVHMASIGHPLVGDPVYGYKKQHFKLEGQLLHAGVLGFIHPNTGEYMEFTTPIPDYFENILKKLRAEN